MFILMGEWFCQYIITILPTELIAVLLIRCNARLNGRNVGGKNWAGDTVVGGKESHLFMVF